MKRQPLLEVDICNLTKDQQPLYIKNSCRSKGKKADNPKEGKKWIKNMNEQFAKREKPKE